MWLRLLPVGFSAHRERARSADRRCVLACVDASALASPTCVPGHMSANTSVRGVALVTPGRLPAAGRAVFWPVDEWWWRVGLYAGFCSGPCGPLAAIHLGRRLPAGSSGLPGGLTGGSPSPCSALLRMGFTEPPGSPRVLVRSYRTVSPLPVRRTYLCRSARSPSAVCSLLHFPAGHPDWALPSILPCGVRTFLGRITTPKSGSVRGHPADSPPLPFNHSPPSTASGSDPATSVATGTTSPSCRSGRRWAR
jgi:hypothetical protein